jgi:hypothetical protein
VSEGVSARWIGAILLIVALAAAVSVDVVKTGYGNKGDEATYVSMALSAAFDHDLTYQRRDLERYWGLYRWGPDGIFLKRGKQWHVRVDGAPPFVHASRTPTPTPIAYFGKALLYPVVVAPFVRVLGLNGFRLQRPPAVRCASAGLLPGRAGAAGPAGVHACSSRRRSSLSTAFLTSDLFNFALVFFGIRLLAGSCAR